MESTWRSQRVSETNEAWQKLDRDPIALRALWPLLGAWVPLEIVDDQDQTRCAIRTQRNTFEPPDAGAGDVADDTEDVDMGQGDGLLQNAPALPKSPTFKGSTKEERRAFMSAYNLYISQTNALTANGVRPFIMPVGACARTPTFSFFKLKSIDPVTKQRVAEWDMGKDPDDLTEGEWIEWFKLAYDVDPRALEGLKKRIAAAVVFDMPITDADSRIGRMLDGMSAVIRRDRQDWVLREESPGIVKIITAAIKPASLQRAVTEQMDMSRNKPLKDVCRFVRWLREYAIGHERFVEYEEEKPVAKQVKFESGKAARVRVENKPASSQPQKVAFAPGASARASPMGCLKCVHGANAVYFTLDWMKGYWQLPLHPESQEYYSFMTPLGVITPTRVLMGQSHAVAYCQGVVEELFGEMIMHGLLGWLDDLLGYARTASDLMDLLKRVLAICQAYGLKLHPKKCAFYTTKTIW
ncbi:hypothetical protein Ae201684P_022348 [Aphanomyces euteiches]|uniref:Reverse transcriptase domain-containing protein n=1 Tax=Aphanomyces euteiches TaxID=100861 RepID=A0A6G0X6K7_9STRA|nr:hypothetical protein Ae201684_008073 [Aphanomyces euteiches]KAH9074541.1 hypothetical protein Ae201684P_022348 [Aphanomyces euteiches]